MLNIDSVNMPKIKPETKVLIIKSKSPAEVADIFNVSKRQVERIRKRYQETGDAHDRPRSGRLRKTTARDDSLLVRLSKARPVSTASQLQLEWTPAKPVLSRTVRQILARNGLHGCIAAQRPALNKRQLRNRVVYTKAHSLTEGWTAEKWQKIDFSNESSVELHPKRRQYCRWPSVARVDPRLPGRSVRWMATLIVPNINRFLPPSTFPTTRAVRFFKRMELLAIPQVPLCFSGGRRSRPFRDGQHSLQIWILLSISGEEWRRKLGGPSWSTLGCLQCGLPCHPWRLHQQALQLQTGLQLFCRPKEPIQDINYLTFSPWWNTRLIFHLLFYLLFEKDKMYWF